MLKGLIPWKCQSHNDLMNVDPTNELALYRATFERMLDRVWQGDWDEVWHNGYGCENFGGRFSSSEEVQTHSHSPASFDSSFRKS